MTTQHDLTADVLQHAITPRGYTLARRISNTFHPMILSIISFLIIALLAVPQWQVGLAWATFGIVLQIVPVTVFFIIRLHQGAYSDEDVSIRQQRNELYFFSMLSLLVGLELFLWFGAPLPVLALLSSAALLVVSGWFINLFWKISVHASSAASCATVAFIYDRPLGLALGICALLVGWARVRTHNHTPLQVSAGFAMAIVCVWGVFHLFALV